MKPTFLLRRALLPLCLLCAVTFAACEDDDSTPDPTLDIGNDHENPRYTVMRLVSYNTYEGFRRSDKAYNYDHFIAWIRQQDPDVVALQELWGWSEGQLRTLAQRYGHSYVAINAKTDDNYHVAFTSKYPIEVVKLISDRVSHGAVHVRIRNIDFVTLHTWPMSTAPTSEHGSAYSPTATDGNSYRLEEITRILDETIGKYSERKFWLLAGDFNAYSLLDADAYSGNPDYAVHRAVLGRGYYDAQRELHDYFISTLLSETKRLDFIYVSKSVLADVVRAEVIRDDYTSNPAIASDHYPCLVEFRRYLDE